MQQYPADIIKGVKKPVARRTITEMTEGTALGSVIGLGGGFLFGYFRKKNLILSALIGMAVGGLISGAFLVKKEKK